MILLAWKNLVHDRGRLAITFVGVSFAVVLMLIQSGIYFGYMNGVSAVIDHSGADLWICKEKTANADTALTIPKEEVLRVRSTPGIAWAEGLTHGWASVRLPDGTNIWAQVIGFNPETGFGGPWEMVQGSFADLRKPGTFIVDEASLPLMPGVRVGDKLENWGNKMEIVGVSRGAKSYNTYPIVFTSQKTAQAQTFDLKDRVHFIMAKVESGADREATIERLRKMRHYEVHTRDGFSGRVRSYWATKTGIGIGIGVTMLLGFIVGLVIVAQTMYSATVERIREYATLKAMGATNWEICSTLLIQAILVALGGYGAGMVLALLFKTLPLMDTVIAVDFDPQLFAGSFVATLFMCLGASVASVARVLRVDPASVFRT